MDDNADARDVAYAPSTSREDSAPPTPRKGILKRPSDIRKERDTIFPLYRQSPDRFPDKGPSRIPKLNVTWTGRNEVAIFGDTSDENNTDSEQPHARMFMTPITKRGSADPPSLHGSSSSPGNFAAHETAIVTDEEEAATPRRARSEERAVADMDDVLSVTSSTGSAASSVVGRWWIAKDTRFVPHCQKRGCNHAGHDDLGEYLTPTQRKNKEVTDLKKELRKALQERDEKEQHLSELRERIGEIEKLTEEGHSMSDNHKLMQGKRELEKAFEAERKATEKRHGVRVNQLIQETMQAREEIAKLTLQLSELEENERERAEKQFADAETATEIVDPMYAGIYHAPPLPLSPTGELHPMSPGISPLNSPAHPFDAQTMQQYVSRETANQLQAYRNEAVIWRSKAAQLELVVRDHLLKTSEQENNLSVELEMMRRECERLREMLRERESEGMADSGIENPAPSSPLERRRPLQQMEAEAPLPPPGPPGSSSSGDCLSSACTDRKRVLINENKRLVETIDDISVRLAQSEEALVEMRVRLTEMEQERETLRGNLVDAEKELEMKKAEVSAAALSINRIQGEKDTLSKAVTYLEERLQVYQNTMMEHDLVVQDENCAEWRKGFIDPRYKVCVSKRSQTVLTAEALTENEDEFQNIQIKLKALDEEFSAKRADLHDRFVEIEANLLTKTQLADTLSRQLSEAQKEAKHSMEERQRERDEHETAMNRLMTVAEKVPVLEARIEQAQREKAELEVRMAGTKDEFERALEEALAEALNKYTQQSRYWKEKLATIEKQLNTAKSETAQVLKERDEQRMKWKVDRADLERKLTSSIGHVEELREKIHAPRRDAECEARPKHVSKYVACRPHTKTRHTEIEKGDFPSATEDRLLSVQQELATTKKQMHVLQQKFIDSLNEKQEQRFKVRSRVPSADSLAPSGDERRAVEVQCPSVPRMVNSEHSPMPETREDKEEEEKRLRELTEARDEIRELTRKLQQLESEKVALSRGEKDRLHTLVKEFDALRSELDQENVRYESEKKWLKQRISNLESSNEELQKTVEGFRALEQEASEKRVQKRAVDERIRKTYSEPRLAQDQQKTEEEVQRLLREKAVLNKELCRVRELLARSSARLQQAQQRETTPTSGAASFAELVSDLNTARNDLERVLITLDREEDEVAVATVSSTHATDARRAFKESPETILDIVMTDWKNDEVENLARELKRSRQERESLRLRVDRLSKQMREAAAELEIYRREGRCLSPEGLPLKRQSRSTVDLTREAVDLDECIRWKEKTGTMFRELTRLRNGYQESQTERRDLRVQLAIMRGELELARCQIAELTGEDTSEQRRTEKAKSEQPERRRTSATATSRENRPPRPSRKDDSSRERPPKDPFVRAERAPSEESRVERVSAWVREPSSRTRSEERRRRSKSRGEKRRNSKGSSLMVKDSSPFSFHTAAQSLGSMPSLPTARVPSSLMSHSWHTAVNSEESEASLRRNSRMVSLREKVTRMNKENKELRERIESFEKEKTAQPQTPNELRDERDRLKKDNEKLKRDLKERKNSEPTIQLVVDASKQEIDELRDENSALRKSVNELKQKLRTSSASPSARSNKWVEEAARLREENAQLRERLERAERRRFDSFASASLSIPAPSMTQSAHAALSRSLSACARPPKKDAAGAGAKPTTKSARHSPTRPIPPPHGTPPTPPVVARRSSPVGSEAPSRPASAPDPGWCHSASSSDVEGRLREDNSRLATVLSEENKRLKAALEKMKKDSAGISVPRSASMDVAREEREKLRASNERLREAIEQLKSENKPASSCRDVEMSELKEINASLTARLSTAEKEKQRTTKEKSDLSDRLRLSTTQTELYDKKLREMEEERKEMYLVMFKKGQQAAAMGSKEEGTVDSLTEDRIVLRFLHDAFYYFLLNKGDSKEHLQAMMTMLNFTSEQREDVAKKRGVP
ncbi:hypothetical protein PMAYCL1PPCAC_03517 [Pristionchus mayeri]|uniref:GRIP domain-containing protein n=1 Tax=Pristionchus mayeri TaxID=1317129 RepID=A0AAN4Z2G0_9BILA|nr:hypothetical protein PMAYCL1PPCAC_03517 [Pristionchus mayeri]